ncbi:hypothetical protein CBQ26_14370 [Deinococcus indicus]|uniref:Uncharacterized protein n=2 Tax=Deinococcus indicus TaxID=223556 RepID=A0A246BHH4_9DEIO|nr:hypothetical protein [Deinococcus indicus]OWL94700.1 hypothetical protein CBQ26_14370 [Deinococcus indicus]
MKPPPNPNGPNSLTPTPGNLTSALDRFDSERSIATLIRWSELLGSLDPADRLKPLQQFERALHKGMILSAPLPDTFTTTYLDATGQDATHEGPDDLVLDTPELRTWLAAQVIESRYALVQHGAPIRITAEQIISGELDFTRLASIRRTMAGQRLQPQPQVSKAPKAPASDKAKADPRTRKTTPPKDTRPTETTPVTTP